MKKIVNKTAHLISRNILSTAAVIALMGAAAFAAAPTGGYLPGTTLDPDCAPGDTDCIVQNVGTEIDPSNRWETDETGGFIKSLTSAGISHTGITITDSGDILMGDIVDVATLGSNTNKDFIIHESTGRAIMQAKTESDHVGNGYAAIVASTTSGTVGISSHAETRTLSRFGLTLGGWNEIISRDWLNAGTPEGLIMGVYENLPLVFGTDDKERMRITGSGSIGMGVTEPESQLHVRGGMVGNNPAMIRIQSQTESNTNPGDFYAGIEFGVNGGENSAGPQEVTAFVKAVDTRNGNTSYDDGGLAFGTLHHSGTGAETHMTLASDGNLGIGTSTPGAKLHVLNNTPLGDTEGDNLLLTRVAGKSGTSNYFKENKWLVRDADGDNWFTNRFHNGISIDVSYGNPGINTRTWWERDPYNNVQSWGNSASTYMTIGSSGNLGVGTKSPVVDLQVEDEGGNADVVVRTTDAAGRASIYFEGSDDTSGAAVGSDYFVVQQDASKIAKIDNYGGDVALQTFAGTGNVGIGVASPQDKLHVKGSLMLEGGTSYAPFRLSQYGSSSIDNHIRIGTDTGHYRDSAMEVYQDNTNNGVVDPGHVVVNGHLSVGNPNGTQTAALKQTDKFVVHGTTRSETFITDNSSVGGVAPNVWTDVSCLTTTNSHNAYTVSIFASGDGNKYRMSVGTFVRSAYNSSYNETTTAAHFGNMGIFEYRINNNGTINNQLQVRVNASNTTFGFKCMRLY